MQPVAWVYMGAHRRKGRESFILTVILLVVVVVEGIVARVRFRLTLVDTLDAVYIFFAIGVGLAAGKETLEIGLVVTLFFNYVILAFWELEYSQEVSVDHWFTKTWVTKIWINKGQITFTM